MKSSTRLDSALFKLTPTRTRCDLVITANGKTEKLATGLLNPFLAHLKTAQEQVAKGGYSIILEPESGVSWFTKGTLERFVRFVSTPEVLERVYTLESEILQIEEAIAIQGNSEVALSTVEDSPVKPVDNGIEASRPSPDTSDEKAIVLYKPGENPPESNGSTAQGGNSKVQLLKVLETRKTVLQKEQGMAFARAVAAGFDIDNISPLMSFSECFGASRLRDACKRFKELWKKKHETGQWVEIEAAEAMSNRADFTAAMNASGIILSSVANAELSSESNGKVTSTDEKPLLEHQTPPQGHPEYFQGQFPHHMYPAWPIQSPPGTVPVFQPYPIPYYQNYPGPAPYFQPPYPGPDDPRLNPGLRMSHKRHSMDDSNGNNTESDTFEAEVEVENESRSKRGSRKKKPGVVVIRNINYIASKGQDGSDSGSESESETRDEDGPMKSSRMDKNVGSNAEAEGGSGHWEAFQNFLLRDSDEDKRSSDQGMFSTENKANSKRRQSRTNGGDPILFGGQENGESRNGGVDVQNMSGSNARGLRRGSADEPMNSRRDGSNGDVDSQSDVLYSEVNGRRLAYRRSTNDGDHYTVDRESGFAGSSDPLAANGFDRPNNKDKKSSNNMDDDSYIVSSRGQGGAEGRNAVDVDSEIPADDHQNRQRQSSYEPEGLSMMPRRGAENGAAGYDPALEYEMQGGSRSKKVKEAAAAVSKKLVEKGSKSRVMQDDRKRNVGPIRRGKPSKLSPLEEARARAEKLRTFKADLQKMKKEKEAVEMKRLEALKMERQKRITARGGGSTVPAPPPARKQVPTRASSTFLRSSKFSDAEPGSASPLQRYHSRTGSVGSVDSQKTSKTVSRLTRSTASLPVPKRLSSGGSGGAAAASETKATASMVRLRRLSEPRISNHPIATLRAKSVGSTSKQKSASDIVPEVKKLSAIVNYDKGKAATLPELKIRTATPVLKGRSVKSEGVEAKKKNEKFSSNSDGDENPIVEKTVVMLECEKPSVPLVADYASIPPVDIANQVSTSEAKNEISKVLNVDTTVEKLYQAPHARASSFEDPCTENSEYGKAGPTSLEPTGSASFKAQVFDSRGLKLEKIPEVSEKAQAKESSSSSVKGIRRLLKFGRKSSGSGAERNNESDNVSLNGSDTDDNGTNAGVSSEVYTLKNLISQDETPTSEATPQKSSRHFSLLSPFRSSKSSEKK